MKGNVSIKEAARLMNKSEMFVRIGLHRGLLPIGVAVQTSSKYTYHISPKLLKDYLGDIWFTYVQKYKSLLK